MRLVIELAEPDSKAGAAVPHSVPSRPDQIRLESKSDLIYCSGRSI
jgi:hypothetical protein